MRQTRYEKAEAALERTLAAYAMHASLSRREHNALTRLVESLTRTKLVDADSRVSTRLPLGWQNTYLGGLTRLAKRYRQWIRPPETFKRRSHNRDRQFAALARHLRATYQVPGFMDEAWFSGHGDHQQWFMRIGRGHNIRHERALPIAFTKRMAHAFINAPDGLGVAQAIRWAQLLGMGARHRTVEAILGTRKGTSFKDDAFWVTVFRFFIAHPMLDTVHYGPIVDYLQNQRFDGPPQAIIDRRLVTLGPPQPNLSMHGRTPDAMLRAVRRWHVELGQARGQRGRNQVKMRSWQALGAGPFEQVEGAKGQRRWLIRELLSTEALIDEGRTMGHCVASYSDSCAAGRSAIYSMLSFEKKSVQRLLTIELTIATREIVQIAGKHNRVMSETERRIIEAWATRMRLTVSDWL